MDRPRRFVLIRGNPRRVLGLMLGAVVQTKGSPTDVLEKHPTSEHHQGQQSLHRANRPDR